MSAPVTRHLTILLTDIKGFTDKTSRCSRSDIQTLLDQHRQIVLPVLEARGGKLIKTIGDAFLMIFESPTDAVLAGVAVQEALAKHNAGTAEDDRIEIRIAINAGEVNLADNDVFGEAVNITARIEGIAQAGEVFFTEAVYLAMNKAEVPSSEVGLLQLKGIPQKVRVYKVRRERPVEGHESSAPPAGGWSLPRPAVGGSVSEPEPKAAMVISQTRPSVWRRAAALALDGILCSMLVSMLVSGRNNMVRISHEHGEEVPNVQIGKDGIGVASKGKEISVGNDGIRIVKDGKNISVGKDGVRIVKDGKIISVGDDGVSIQKTGSSKDSTMDDDDEDGEVLYEKDGLKVKNPTSKRSVAFPLLWLAYSTLFLGLWKATPGKRILKLVVVRMDGSAIDWKDAFVRSLFTLISGYALFLGFFWALWEKDRRGWHDLLAGTRVATKSE